MTKIQKKKYNDMIKRINNISDKDLDKLIKQDKCPFQPEHLKGVPLGMFHCEVCGEMVVAGVSHPRYGKDSVLYKRS